MAYTKLDAGLPDSTIWQAPDTTRIVWITLLAMADQNGYVGASMPGLAGRARVSLEACIAAMELLSAPDEWSRTKDFDGRRIGPADGGWILLNHAKYRAAQNAEDRRERSRLAMAALRASRKQQAITQDNGYQKLAELPQAEAEAENTPLTPLSRGERFEKFWEASKTKTDKPRSRKAFDALDPDEQTLFAMMAAAKNSDLAPATFIRGRRWEDELPNSNRAAEAASKARREEDARQAELSRGPAAHEARRAAMAAHNRRKMP